MSSTTLNATVSADEAEILALGAALHKAHLEKNPEGIASVPFYMDGSLRPAFDLLP
jgi:hypothetical protein